MKSVVCKIGVGLLLLLLIFVGSLPRILSSSWGKELFLKIVNRNTPSELKLATLSLNWISGQHLEGVEFFDAHKTLIFQCKEIDSSAPLWKILFARDVGSLRVIQPQGIFVQKEVSTSSTPGSSSQGHVKKKQSFSPFKGRVYVEEGSLKMQDVHFEEVFVDMLMDSSLSTVQCRGKTTLNKVSGDFVLTGNADLLQETGELQARLSHFPLQGLDQFLPFVNPELLGPSCDLELNAQKTKESAFFKLQATTANLTAQMNAISQDGMLTLATPAQVNLKISPAFLTPLALTKPLMARLTINDLRLPLNNLSQMSAKIHVEADSYLSLSGEFKGLNQLLFQGSSQQLPLAGLKKPLDATFTGSLENQQLQLAVDTPTFGHVQFTATSLEEITALVTIQEQKITLQMHGPSYEINAKNPSLNMHLALILKEGVLQLQGSRNKISLTLSQEIYALLAQNFPEAKNFELVKSSHIVCTLSSFKLPLQQETFASSELQGTLTMDTLSVREKTTGKLAALHDLDLSVTKRDPSQPILFSLKAATSPQGSITMNGQVENAFSNQDLKAHVNLSLQNFPSLLLDVMSLSSKWSALFGNTLDATLATTIQKQSGPVQLTVQSPNTRLALNGALHNGSLLLADPIYAQITMTPAVAALLLDEVNPLSISNLSANNPLTLEIDPVGFSLPLFPFNLIAATVPHARIELGQITCKNEGNLNITLGLLKSKEFSSNKELKLWFAPIDLQLSRGLMGIERTEILVAETFDIALWGNVDLAADYVDMVLGLTGDCLSKAFGIKNLPKNYVLQIPMKGPSNDVKIDKGKATAKIATLLIWQQKMLGEALGKSPAGALFKGIIGSAVLPDMDKTAPPPKHPFPWEVNKLEKKKSSNKANIKPKDKPLKQLLKVYRS